jgi:diguanylate cyclase (GGDEF)-like protein/PAS domain S-box-containing protein
MFIRVFDCIQTVHDPWLVMAAIFTASLSGFALFTVLDHARGQQHYARPVWLVAGACVAGGGIWSAHFIAMLGFHPAATVSYDTTLTLVSAAVAIALAGAAIPFLLSSRFDRVLSGGVILGAAIGAMHFTGMAALVFSGTISWDPRWVVLSLGCGIGLASASALLACNNERRGSRMTAAGLFGAAICTLHFIAMRAAVLNTDPTAQSSNGTFSETLLGLSVAFSTSLIVVLSLILVVFDRRANRACADARHARSIMETVRTGLLVCEDNIVIEANRTFAQLVGVEQAAITGRPLADFVATPFPTGDDQHRRMAESEALLTTTDGTQLAVGLTATAIRSGKVPRLLIEVRDIRLQKQEQERIAHLANHDMLTGLPNRRLFELELQRAVENAARSDHGFALLWIDLDHFKAVNDLYGHAVGDDVLRTVADRFRSALGEPHLVARIGGDEFVVLTPTDPAAVAQWLLDAMTAPISTKGREVNVGLSIGLANYPRDAASVDALLHLADCALYDAKKAGRGRWRSSPPAEEIAAKDESMCSLLA